MAATKTLCNTFNSCFPNLQSTFEFDWGVFELYILNYIEESTHKFDFSIVV